MFRLEASMEADFPSFRDSRSLVLDQPEIVSSQELPVENNRQNRALIASATSTIIAYSFSTTVVTKSFTLAAANALSCLPAGFTVC